MRLGENQLFIPAAFILVHCPADCSSVNMMVWLTGVLLAAGVWLASCEEFKLPSYIDVCYRDDPEVAKCLKKTIEKLVPIFKSGSRDFDLDSLDPLVYPTLLFKYKSSVIGGSLALTDSRVNGLSKLNVVQVRPKLNNPDKLILDFDVDVPFVNITTYYNLTGNVARVPVNIDGFLDIDMDYINMTFHLAGDVKTIGEYDFLDLKKFYWRLRGEGIRNARIVNNDVVSGYPALNRIVKTVVNSSWRVLKDNILPVALRETEDSLRDIFAGLFKKYPYDILFPRKTRL